MRDGSYENISREMIWEKLESVGLLEETRKRAYDYARLAIKNLELLPDYGA